MASEITLGSYWRLLRSNRNFRLLWMAQVVSELGDWFYSVAIYSFLIEVTGSARTVAVAFVLQVLPQCFAAPTAGVINDRVSRRKVMIFADWMRAGIVLAMILVRSREMIWLLYLLLFLETIHWALFEPGRSAVIPNITSGNDIAVANALSSTTWSINFAVGSGLGGLVAAFFGRESVFVLNSLSFVGSALLIARMRFAEPHAESRPPLRARDLADFSPIAEGARYVTSDRRLLATMLVKAGLGLMGTNWVIIPLLGERVFPLHMRGLNPDQAGTLSMSIMLSARGVGAILGAFGGAQLAGIVPRRLRMAILAGFVAAAAGYLGLGAMPSLWLVCATLILAHAGGSTVWTSSTTLLQQQAEDRFRGRVFSAEFAFSMLLISLTSFAAGVVVDAGVDVRAVAYATGALLLAPAVAWALAQRLWKRRQFPR